MKIIKQAYPLVTITGTKGKTTTVRLLDYVYRNLGFDTLRVDTDGHFVNGKKKSDYFYSRKYWGIVPNNCPGRYLFELANKPLKSSKKAVCLLEAALGSSSSIGLGYFRHDIGVLTNIYRDHITNVRIKNKNDIYKAKSFIFKALAKKGTFIYNSSDEYIVKKISKENITQKKIAVGYHCTNLKKFLNEGNYFFEINTETKELVFHSKQQTVNLTNLKNIPFTFDGVFEPNLFNVSFVYAILYAEIGEKRFFKKIKVITKILQEYTVDQEGGRMVFVEKDGYKIIVDFAHELESFKQIALLAKNISSNRVIGVLRIDPSRINKDILNTAKQIGKYYDFIYIYDKVDGEKMKESIGVAEGKKRGIGETAELFAQYLEKFGYQQYKVVVKEDKAFKEAVKNVQDGDVIIYIGDGFNHQKTLKTAQGV